MTQTLEDLEVEASLSSGAEIIADPNKPFVVDEIVKNQPTNTINTWAGICMCNYSPR